tara:strand:- start:3194 stop:4207 length:1014 start_codon:yes stop_codon:yes gene_type:complete
MELDATQEAALRNLPKSCLCTMCLNPMTGNIDDSAPVEVCQSHHHVCRGCSRSLRRRTCPECRQPVRAHFIKNIPLKRMIEELVDTALRAYEQHEQPSAPAAAPDAPDAGTVAALNSQVSQMQARIRQLEETNSEQAAGMEAFVDELTTDGRPSSGPVRLRAEPQPLSLPAQQAPAPVILQQSRGERAVQLARQQQQRQEEQKRQEERRLAREKQHADEINALQYQFMEYSKRFKDEVSLSSCRTNKRKDVTAWNAAKLCLMELDGDLALYVENHNLPAVRTLFLNGPPPTLKRCQHAKAYLNEWGVARNMSTNGDAHLRQICFAIERHIHPDDLQA